MYVVSLTEAKKNAGSEHLTEIGRSLLAQKAMNQPTMDAFFTRAKRAHRVNMSLLLIHPNVQSYKLTTY